MAPTQDGGGTPAVVRPYTDPLDPHGRQAARPPSATGDGAHGAAGQTAGRVVWEPGTDGVPVRPLEPWNQPSTKRQTPTPLLPPAPPPITTTTNGHESWRTFAFNPSAELAHRANGLAAASSFDAQSPRVDAHPIPLSRDRSSGAVFSTPSNGSGSDEEYECSNAAYQRHSPSSQGIYAATAPFSGLPGVPVVDNGFGAYVAEPHFTCAPETTAFDLRLVSLESRVARLEQELLAVRQEPQRISQGSANVTVESDGLGTSSSINPLLSRTTSTPSSSSLNTNAPIFVPSSPIGLRAPLVANTQSGDAVDRLHAQMDIMQNQMVTMTNALALVINQQRNKHATALSHPAANVPMGSSIWRSPSMPGLGVTTAGVSLPAPTYGVQRDVRGRTASTTTPARRLSWNASTTMNGNGDHFQVGIDISAVGPPPPPPTRGSTSPRNTLGPGPVPLSSKWEALGLKGDVLREVLRYGIGAPLRSLYRTVPIILQGQDIVAQTSNTNERIQAYVVPLLQLLYNGPEGGPAPVRGPRTGLQALIITSTADEAGQAHRLLNGIGSGLGIRAALCVGDPPPNHSETLLEIARFQQSAPHVLLGTPQRIHDLVCLRILPLNELRFLVVDEVDQILARSLNDFVTTIVHTLLPPAIPAPSPPQLPTAHGDVPPRNHLPRVERQTCITSCTVPSDVLGYAQSLNLREPVRTLIRRDEPADAVPHIRGLRQYYTYVAADGSMNGTRIVPAPQLPSPRGGYKLDAFGVLMARLGFSNCVVFCNSVDAVEQVALRLATKSISVFSMHGEQSATARLSALTRFKAQTSAARPGKLALVVNEPFVRMVAEQTTVQLVVNYDLPDAVDDYIHRVACATAPGRGGTVINILTTGHDLDVYRAIEDRTRISELPASVSF